MTAISHSLRTAAALAAAVAIATLSLPAVAEENSGRRHVVDIRSLKFQPVELVVAPGDTIVWINHDIVPHTATAGDKSWDSKSIGKESQWETIVQPGMAEEYFCRFHPNMKARLQITAGSAETD